MNDIKEFRFDLELIIDYDDISIMGKKVYSLATHRTYRGLTLSEVNKIINLNEIPRGDNRKITIIMRGVNF